MKEFKLIEKTNPGIKRDFAHIGNTILIYAVDCENESNFHFHTIFMLLEKHQINLYLSNLKGIIELGKIELFKFDLQELQKHSLENMRQFIIEKISCGKLHTLDKWLNPWEMIL